MIMGHIFSGGIHLPFDVIHLIISELASDKDIGSLKACSLTCTAILPLARKHIFATVEVDNVDGCEPGEKPPADSFKWLLESDPSIADYVRKFKYVEFLNSDHDRPRWPVLRNATVLGFGFDYHEAYIPENMGRQVWENIASSLRASFSDFVSSSSIYQLSLWNITFPLSFFQQIPCLSCLEIHNISLVDAADPGSFQKTKLTHLRILDTYIEDLKPLLGATFDLTQLQELYIEYFVFDSFYDVDVIGGLISASEQLRILGFRGESCHS
jgi:hypothetical protein